jgi:hypothetical protein
MVYKLKFSTVRAAELSAHHPIRTKKTAVVINRGERSRVSGNKLSKLNLYSLGCVIVRVMAECFVKSSFMSQILQGCGTASEHGSVM